MKLIKTYATLMTTALLCTSHAHAAATGAGAVAEEAFTIPAGAVVINNIADWEGCIAEWEGNSTKQIYVTADLTFTDAAKHDIPAVPPFKGYFNGGNHEFTIDRRASGPASFAGLFKEVDTTADGLSIGHFTLNFGNFSDATYGGYLGTLVCTLINGSLDHINVKIGSLFGGKDGTGGLVGRMLGGSIGSGVSLEANEPNCSIRSLDGSAGGVIGHMSGGSSCASVKIADEASLVVDHEYVGGLVGHMHAGPAVDDLVNSITIGGITPAAEYAGGLVGSVGVMSPAPAAESAEEITPAVESESKSKD